MYWKNRTGLKIVLHNTQYYGTLGYDIVLNHKIIFINIGEFIKFQ
jgi:hypothetical protein